MSLNGLHFNHRTESGVLFHMIGAVSEFGKLGVTVIGNDVEEVERLYGRVIDVLDAECTIGQTPSGQPWGEREPRADVIEGRAHTAFRYSHIWCFQ